PAGRRLPTSTSPDRYRRTVRRLICRYRAIALIVQPHACSALASTTGSHASIVSGLPRLVTIRSDHRVEGAPCRRWDLPPATHQLGTFSEQVWALPPERQHRRGAARRRAPCTPDPPATATAARKRPASVCECERS